MPSLSRAAILRGERDLVVMELPVHALGLGEALLRVEACGICKSDYSWYTGTLPVPTPLVLGHEIVGTVVALGTNDGQASTLAVGDRVVVEGNLPCRNCSWCLQGNYHLCDHYRSYGTSQPITTHPGLWGGLAEYLHLARGSLVHPIPREMPVSVAVLICSVVANGIRWLTEVGEAGLGDHVVILGPGQQGLAAVVAAREAGAATVTLVGRAVDRERLQLARELGADCTLEAETEPLEERLREVTRGEMADVVLEVTGAPGALTTALQLVRKRGTVVVAGLQGKHTTEASSQDLIVFKEARVLGAFTQNSRNVRKAIALAASGKYPLDRIVSHWFPLSEVEQAILAVGGELDFYPIKAAVSMAGRP